jgi:CheY-like chemotaxis protein
MDKKQLCIMLVDDNYDDNFFHERVIKKSNLPCTVITKSTGAEALEYLRAKETHEAHPDLIFLDINMPKMNGWEFLEAYHQLNKELKSEAIVIMLTTSDNIDDVQRAQAIASEYYTKPLTKEKFLSIVKKYLDPKV